MEYKDLNDFRNVRNLSVSYALKYMEVTNQTNANIGYVINIADKFAEYINNGSNDADLIADVVANKAYAMIDQWLSINMPKIVSMSNADMYAHTSDAIINYIKKWYASDASETVKKWVYDTFNNPEAVMDHDNIMSDDVAENIANAIFTKPQETAVTEEHNTKKKTTKKTTRKTTKK